MKNINWRNWIPKMIVAFGLYLITRHRGFSVFSAFAMSLGIMILVSIVADTLDDWWNKRKRRKAGED